MGFCVFSTCKISLKPLFLWLCRFLEDAGREGTQAGMAAWEMPGEQGICLPALPALSFGDSFVWVMCQHPEHLSPFRAEVHLAQPGQESGASSTAPGLAPHLCLLERAENLQGKGAKSRNSSTGFLEVFLLPYTAAFTFWGNSELFFVLSMTLLL